MSFIEDTDRIKISDAIGVVEGRTSGELVAVVANESDQYLYIPLLWASLVALLAPLLFYLLPAYWGLFDAAPGWGGARSVNLTVLHTTQVAVFIVFAVLFRWTPLKYHIVPKWVRHRRAHLLAIEQFFGQGLHLTRDRTGVLLFVSVGERYVEIVADKTIDERVPDGAWDDAIAEFVEHVRAGDVANGFLRCIERCGAVLAQHAPAEGDDNDELPNRLIEI